MAGRPTIFKESMLSEIIDLPAARRLKEPMVYGLCRNDVTDVFYVGSTRSPDKRMASYAAARAHGNKALADHLENPFKVVVFYVGPDFRDIEFDVISEYGSSLCNIITAKRGFKRSPPSASGAFLRKFTNAFRNEQALEYAKEIRSTLKAMSKAERLKAEERFALLQI